MENMMPKPPGYRSLHLHLPPELHKKLRVAVAIKETTLRDYVRNLIENDLDNMTRKSLSRGRPAETLSPQP